MLQRHTAGPAPRAFSRPHIHWRDLTALSARDVASELLISLPWLVMPLVLANAGWILLALPCSFMFFLTGLRQIHGAFHYSLGLRRTPTELVMFGLSVLMLGSMHAVQFNHLRHHAHCMEEDDVEALSARMLWWRAVLYGPLFPVRLHLAAWSHARDRQRRWIAAELAVTVAVVASAGALGLGWLRYHVVAMAIGHCLTAFFAVWTVHHDCEESVPARTIRGRLKPFVTYEMFYHLEHHLFPAVPTRRLPELARRLDAVAPELSERRVFRRHSEAPAVISPLQALRASLPGRTDPPAISSPPDFPRSDTGPRRARRVRNLIEFRYVYSR